LSDGMVLTFWGFILMVLTFWVFILMVLTFWGFSGTYFL